MNPHPIFVHFPIALLTIYAVLEIVAFFSHTLSIRSRGIRAFLSIVGTLSVFPTLFTGEIAEHKLLSADSPMSLRTLVEAHSTFATLTAIVFSILALSYLFVWIKLQFTVTVGGENHKSIGTILDDEYKHQTGWIGKLPFWLISTYPASILALIGLILITVTGALGGAIVYGPNVDPVVNLIYQLVV